MVTALTDDQLADLKRAVYGPLADDNPTPGWGTLIKLITAACDRDRAETFAENALRERIEQTLPFADVSNIPAAIDMLCRHLDHEREANNLITAAATEMRTAIAFVRAEGNLPAHLDDRLSEAAATLHRAQWDAASVATKAASGE